MATLALLTIRQLAEHIVSQLDLSSILAKPFPACDFCSVDVDRKTIVTEEQMESLHTNAWEWHGIKKIDDGFNSTSLCVIADYYGGGCAVFGQLLSGCEKDGAVDYFTAIITASLENQEVVNDSTLLLVDFMD